MYNNEDSTRKTPKIRVEMAKSDKVAEYTDCISTEGLDSPNECPGYNTKQSDGEAAVMLELRGMQSTLHCHRS